ncbi:hypothetical protein [Pseudaminobacter sp. NGMCC 1.201702]|uniref:hypothetical protein n=1 Tax=Pseudaminobacter sp. NGMCC 1.201702 TaxID=3391825 RepID=UPI0039EE725A
MTSPARIANVVAFAIDQSEDMAINEFTVGPATQQARASTRRYGLRSNTTEGPFRVRYLALAEIRRNLDSAAKRSFLLESFDVCPRGVGSSRVRLTVRPNEDVRTVDAVLLNQMFYCSFRFFTGGEDTAYGFDAVIGHH